MTAHVHRAPADCPVCGERLATTRLGCRGCGTELVGLFECCRFCALDAEDRDLLTVFLTSNGNLKAVEKHLEVSYPTARSRYRAVLAKLGLTPGDDDGPSPDAEPEPADSNPDAPAGAPDAPRQPEADDETPGSAGESGGSVRDEVLAQVASGVLSPDAAADLLGQLGHSE